MPCGVPVLACSEASIVSYCLRSCDFRLGSRRKWLVVSISANSLFARFRSFFGLFSSSIFQSQDRFLVFVLIGMGLVLA